MEVGKLKILFHWELSQNKVIQSKINKIKGIVFITVSFYFDFFDKFRND